MATPKRHRSVPGTYFVTSKTWQGRALFVRDHPACAIFVQTILDYRTEGAYQMHAFVLMPDHFHVLLTPGETLTLERAVQFIKGGSAHRIGKELGCKFPVWNRGFSDHRIRDGRDYAHHVGYIERNPVKRGLVAEPQEYRWSSALGSYALDKMPQGLKPLTTGEVAGRHG
jgi:putative transposase